MTEHSTDDSYHEKAEQIALPQNIFFALMTRSGLVKPGGPAVLTAGLVFVALTLLPLIIICAMDGTAFAGKVKMPIFQDFTTLTRFLVVGPCLLLCEAVTKPWLLKVTQNFIKEKLIPEEKLENYQHLVKQMFNLRESLAVEIAILLIAIVSSILFSKILIFTNLQPSSWYSDMSASGLSSMSSAGKWHTYVSQPLFRFLILDWIFEYLLWIYFLLRVACFPPRIEALHPDGVGGLGFVGVGQTQFGIAAFALSAAFCSVVADAIITTGATIQSFTNLGIAWVATLLVLFQGPLLVFTPILIRKKREAIFQYSNLSRYTCDAFSKKWIPAKVKHGTDLLESDDASAIADLSANFHTVQEMRTTIFWKQSITSFLVCSCLPAIPLVASVMPLNELLEKLLKAIT
ncbi:MAG: hypothetical protein K2X27_24740 [Candidatus Obscuribacterales bacterium]|nr:hypothetical protein [Candidatus Obscuribacterales bacterium]